MHVYSFTKKLVLELILILSSLFGIICLVLHQLKNITAIYSSAKAKNLEATLIGERLFPSPGQEVCKLGQTSCLAYIMAEETLYRADQMCAKGVFNDQSTTTKKAFDANKPRQVKEHCAVSKYGTSAVGGRTVDSRLLIVLCRRFIASSQ